MYTLLASLAMMNETFFVIFKHRASYCRSKKRDYCCHFISFLDICIIE